MDIPLGILSTDARTEQGDLIKFYRPYVTVGFRTRGDGLVRRRCLIDTGAPLCVIPYTVWQHRNLAWSAVSKQLYVVGQATALSWQGVPCELGFAEVELAGIRNLTGKFAMRATPLAEVILGLNFFTDNEIELVLRGALGALNGFMSLP